MFISGFCTLSITIVQFVAIIRGNVQFSNPEITLHSVQSCSSVTLQNCCGCKSTACSPAAALPTHLCMRCETGLSQTIRCSIYCSFEIPWPRHRFHLTSLRGIALSSFPSAHFAIFCNIRCYCQKTVFFLNDLVFVRLDGIV